ncbi:TPA: glycosyltransferase [Streptococcus suis]
MKKIAVILSTYNGEKYLKEQMDSLLSQEGVDITLFVRDDGSTDRTVEMIQSYSDKMDILLFKESNVGFERSFRAAVLKTEGRSFDFYAFCDQDDIWYEDKLAKGIDYIESLGNNEPILYCSNQQIIDEQGLFVRDEGEKQNRITKESSLFALNQRGCVMVWNKSLHNHLISSYRLMDSNSFIPPHDTWITVLAYATGCVYLDSSITMAYRVSSHNTAGSYIGLIGRVKYICKKIGKVCIERKNHRKILAELLLSYLITIPTYDTKYINDFLHSQKSFFNSLRFVLISKEYFIGMSKKWTILTKILLLLRRI